MRTSPLCVWLHPNKYEDKRRIQLILDTIRVTIFKNVIAIRLPYRLQTVKLLGIKWLKINGLSCKFDNLINCSIESWYDGSFRIFLKIISNENEHNKIYLIKWPRWYWMQIYPKNRIKKLFICIQNFGKAICIKQWRSDKSWMNQTWQQYVWLNLLPDSSFKYIYCCVLLSCCSQSRKSYQTENDVHRGNSFSAWLSHTYHITFNLAISLLKHL